MAVSWASGTCMKTGLSYPEAALPCWKTAPVPFSTLTCSHPQLLLFLNSMATVLNQGREERHCHPCPPQALHPSHKPPGCVRLFPLCDLSPTLSSPPLLVPMVGPGSLPIWVDPPPLCQVSAVVTSVKGTDSQDVTFTWPFLPPPRCDFHVALLTTCQLDALVVHSFPPGQIPWDQVTHRAPVYMQPRGQGDFWLTELLFPLLSQHGRLHSPGH